MPTATVLIKFGKNTTDLTKVFVRILEVKITANSKPITTLNPHVNMAYIKVFDIPIRREYSEKKLIKFCISL